MHIQVFKKNNVTARSTNETKETIILKYDHDFLLHALSHMFRTFSLILRVTSCSFHVVFSVCNFNVWQALIHHIENNVSET